MNAFNYRINNEKLNVLVPQLSPAPVAHTGTGGATSTGGATGTGGAVCKGATPSVEQ